MPAAQDASFSDKLVSHAFDRLDRLRDQLDAALGSGEVDAVHGTRVASRRLNEALLIMSPWLNCADAKMARRSLRKLRDAFRKVRDLDVLQMSLAQPPPGLDPGSLAQLEGFLTRRREKALARAIRKAGRIGPDQLIRHISRLSKQFERRFDDSQDSLVERLSAQFQKLANVILEHEPRSESADLHFVRLRVKRARYGAELAHRVGATSDDTLIKQLTEMQDRTGRWNDHLSAARWIARLARRRQAVARQTAWSLRLLEYTVQRLHAAESERGQILERWPEFESTLRASAWFRGSAVSAQPPQPAPAS